MMKHINEYLGFASQWNDVPLKSGYDFIDDELGGYHPGELMTICGVENSGKTAFIISQIDRLAVEQKIPTIVGIGLMDVPLFMASMIAYHYDIATNNLWGLWDDPGYQDDINEYKSMLKEAPLYVLDNYIQDEDWVKNLSERIAEKGIRMIFLDEWESITIQETSIGLRQLALHTGTTIVKTEVVWNDREVDGHRVALSDFNVRKYNNASSASDTVIAFNDYEFMKIFVDERGVNLRGVLGIEILKKKGVINKKEYRLFKKRLYFRKLFSGSGYDVPESRPIIEHI